MGWMLTFGGLRRESSGLLNGTRTMTLRFNGDIGSFRKRSRGGNGVFPDKAS